MTTTMGKVRMIRGPLVPEAMPWIGHTGNCCGEVIDNAELLAGGLTEADLVERWGDRRGFYTGVYCNRPPHSESEQHCSSSRDASLGFVWGGE